MSNSSQQPDYTIISSSPYQYDTISINSVEIDPLSWTGNTMIGPSSTNLYSSGNVTISTGTTYTVGATGSSGTFSIDTSTINWGYSEEWVDCFPNWDRIQKMCDQYPGLKIAFEKFKTVYTLVKDDYDTPKDKK